MTNEQTIALAAGYRLENYRLEALLGHGGFGITYRALDEDLQQKVAIKEYLPREVAFRDRNSIVIPLGEADRETFEWGLERFLDEARTLARFRHPNIVGVQRFLRANGTAYLVMDYCDGKSLESVLAREGTLAPQRLGTLLVPLLSALEVLHAAGVTHRDIKPGNIYLRADGSPVLLDFGAARQALAQHSRSVTAMATPGYAAFEQYSTKGKQGPWTDIYGLGATLYRCVTGERPPDATDRMLEDDLVPAMKVSSGRYPRSLLLQIDAALKLRPEERPPNVGAWHINSLREYSDHPENGLPAFGVPERSTKESDGLEQPPPTNLRDLTQAEVARIEADWWAPSPGRDIQHNLVLTLEEAAFGTEVKIPGFNTVTCDSCGSSGSERANESDICPVCLGVGQVRLRQGGELTHHICPRCHGSGEVIRPDCKDCGGSGRAREKKTNYVNIPGGIESGDRIRLSGEGEVGVHGGPRGDLYLNIQIKPHELFRREGGNLFCETPISRVTAKDGGTIAVPCLEGRVMLRVPAQTTNGTVFRLPGKGIKSVHSSEVGDLMCRVVFEMSQSRLGRERKAVEERGVHGQRKKWIGITTVLIIFFLLLAHFEVI